MLAGHLGAGLAIGRAERGLNVGVFVAAALLLDLALWILILVGLESVSIPPDFETTRQAAYVFPYSHGLVASLAWAVLAGGVVFALYPVAKERRSRAALLVGAAVFTHWLLDVLVHVPELPLLGERSAKAGLGLWRHLPSALVVEGLVAVLGLAWFLSGAPWSRARKTALTALGLLVLGLTSFGMTIAPPPPSARAMAGSSLVTLLVVGAIAGWLGRTSR